MPLEASFRQESARLVSILVRAFGPARLTLAEDVVQETFLRAVHLWAVNGVPENPTGWLTQVAKRLAIDALRRERIYLPDAETAFASASVRPEDPEMLGDAEVEMLFLCCDPCLPIESQIALTLRELCGLSTREVAKGLMQGEDAVAQRLVRAKKTLRTVDWVTSDTNLAERLVSVLKVIYLMFNEGYASHTDASLVRSELCDEAILLANRISKTKVGNTPATHALMALMLFHSSRLPARVSADGSLNLLAEQDRSLWDRNRIGGGFRHLEQSGQGDKPSAYHFEAGIAATHASAATYADTDWSSVLLYYDLLAELNPSPVILLNRAIALAMVHGPQSGLEQIDAIENSKSLKDYYLLPATKANFLEMLGRNDEARSEYLRALEFAQNPCEQSFLQKKLMAVSSYDTK